MSKEDYEPSWVDLSSEEVSPDAGPEEVSDAALLLRPRSGAQVLDLGVDLFVGRLWACIGIGTLIMFPLRALMPWFLELMDNVENVADMESLLFLSFSMVGLSGASTLATVLCTAAVTLMIHAELLGEPVTGMNSVRGALRRTLKLVGVFLVNVFSIGVVAGLIFVLGLFCPPFLLVAFGVYITLIFKLSLAPSALVLEDLGVMDSIRRSWSLTRGGFWRWAAAMILISTLVVGFNGITALGDTVELRDWFLEVAGMPKTVFTILLVAISSVFAGISVALSAAAMTVFYLDTRIRNEGFDLVMRLERLRLLDRLPGQSSRQAEPSA
ncbi:MAG: hypothetical protein ACI8X5_002102 [Planctomycetota bacterium]|jgi:hypothetical protein